MLIHDAFKFCPLCGSSDFNKNKENNYLECPKCHYKFFLNPITAISAIIINDKKEVLLVKKANGYRKGYWDSPGGFIDNTETLQEAIKREIKEELGVEGEMIDLFYVGNNPAYEYQNILIPVVGIFVTAKLLSGPIIAGDDAEEYKWVPLKEVLNLEIAYPDVRKALEKYINKITN